MLGNLAKMSVWGPLIYREQGFVNIIHLLIKFFTW